MNPRNESYIYLFELMKFMLIESYIFLMSTRIKTLNYIAQPMGTEKGFVPFIHERNTMGVLLKRTRPIFRNKVILNEFHTLEVEQDKKKETSPPP